MDKIDFWGEVREQGTQEQETGREFGRFHIDSHQYDAKIALIGLLFLALENYVTRRLF